MLEESFMKPYHKQLLESPLPKKRVNYCNRMFYLERTWENLSKQERYQLRQEKLKPLMQEFFNWCEKNKTTVLPGSKLGKAINYTLKHQETFEHILLDGNLELSNNKAERAVKSLVMGRNTKL